MSRKGFGEDFMNLQKKSSAFFWFRCSCLSLALPAYEDVTGETYLIYFETSGGVGVPVISSTTSKGKLTSCPFIRWTATPSTAGIRMNWKGDRITVTRVLRHTARFTPIGVPLQREVFPSRAPRLLRRQTLKIFLSKLYAGTFLFAVMGIFTLVALVRQIRTVFYDSPTFAHLTR